MSNPKRVTVTVEMQLPESWIGEAEWNEFFVPVADSDKIDMIKHVMSDDQSAVGGMAIKGICAVALT